MAFEGLSKIGQINIPVRNLEESVRFYRDILGMTFLFQVPNMAFFDCGGIRILLGAGEEETGDRHGSIIYFTVDDIHHTADTLRDRGVLFAEEPSLVAEMPDHDLWMAFFGDPSGNTHALMSKVSR
jgi:methylmalonyl-CoA/ethylmalonyl-CoA epimerase